MTCQVCCIIISTLQYDACLICSIIHGSSERIGNVFCGGVCSFAVLPESMRHGMCCSKFCKEHYKSRGKSSSDRFIAWGGDIIIIIIRF